MTPQNPILWQNFLSRYGQTDQDGRNAIATSLPTACQSPTYHYRQAACPFSEQCSKCQDLNTCLSHSPFAAQQPPGCWARLQPTANGL